MLTKESCKEIVNAFHKSTFDLNVKILTLHTISELSKLEVYECIDAYDISTAVNKTALVLEFLIGKKYVLCTNIYEDNFYVSVREIHTYPLLYDTSERYVRMEDFAYELANALKVITTNGCILEP